MRAVDKHYQNFIDEFSSFIKHYKLATGSSDRAIAEAAGLANATVNRAKRGLASPNLRSFYRILAATGRDDLLADGVLGVRLRTVSDGRQRRAA